MSSVPAKDSDSLADLINTIWANIATARSTILNLDLD